MILSLGPVVRYELITTARRGRFYFVRAAYGLCLLFQLWSLFRAWEATHPGGGSFDEIQAFAEDAFLQFAGLQGIGLMVLIPALVSGVIADEHQRKTLHYLLASRLSSAEIVLGKMGARLVHVACFVALGLPIVSLLMLYGGLNPENILFVYIGTFTTTAFVAGMCIFLSILARRPREAILMGYALLALWLYVPIAISPYAHHLDWPLNWVPPVNEILLGTNPIQLWYEATAASSTKVMFINKPWFAARMPSFWAVGSEFVWKFWIMAGAQLLAGLLFLALAIAGLRPLRGSSWPGSEPTAGWWTKLRKRYRGFVDAQAAKAVVKNELLVTRSSRPSCGDNPMFWKERYTRLGGGLRWLSSRPVALFFSVLLGCFLFDVGAPVVADLVQGKWSYHSWSAMNSAIRGTSVALAFFGMLAVAAASATTLTGEREQDTWISLATTLLNPGEVILAKQYGAIWSAHWIGLAMVISWGLGLLMGALHPLGVLAATAIVAATAWLIAAAGILASSIAKNSTRALAFTFVFLGLLVVLSQSPLNLWLALVSYEDVARLWEQTPPPGYSRVSVRPADLPLLVVVPVLESALAALFTLLSIRRLRATWVA
jgi:ABC-type transport system involved in multi-copper enzyme maturation permease subunit